jgi:hypothetical protein
MVAVGLTSRAIRKSFLLEWILSSVLYFLGLAITRRTVTYGVLVVGSLVLGFAQMFGGTLIRESNRFTISSCDCESRHALYPDSRSDIADDNSATIASQKH